MLRNLRKGQSTAEYAIVIGLVIAAAVAMQVYVKRGIQGKIKDAVNYTDADDNVTGSTIQYEPDYQTTQNMVSTRESQEKESITEGGGVTRKIVGEDVSSRTGTSKILAVND
ncbi:MAG: hypothetical protein PHN16_05915 [Candidatus Omnitrophica bacterium]|jgi:predicted small secreted protein|nr:hypothetical protein [Candidatus Omnitrophota bacterium]MDD3275269.1 hypothetical protein [Candidatus Omnitrophota bacterium]MDD4982245.1 hypothetical protein [Candidatus Omnitrophota bacterium]